MGNRSERGLEDSVAALTRRVEALESALLEMTAQIAQMRQAGSLPSPSGGIPPEDALAPSSAMNLADERAPETAATNLADERPPETAATAEIARESLLPLVGRILLVLGGAFFLRAATDAGILPRTVGAALGLLYGVAFLVLAYRAAGRPGSGHRAQFHGLASALVVFPLLFEATVRFRYLPAPLSAAALAFACGFALWIAWRRKLRGLAWLFVGIGAPLSLVLALTTHLWSPFLGIALAISWSTLLLAYECKWTFLGFSGAVLADTTVLLLTSLFFLQGSKPPLQGLSVSILIALQGALVGTYLGTFSLRTLVRAREIQWLEVVQAFAVLVVGMGGALALAQSHPRLAMVFGVVSLAAAALSYGISFAFIDRRRGRDRNFMFYTSIALALMLVAVLTLLESTPRTWMLLVLAVLTAILATWKQRVTLLLHATVFTFTAAISSSLLGTSIAGLLGREAPLESSALVPFAAVILVTALCTSLQVLPRQGVRTRLVSAPRSFCLSLFILCCCGLAMLVAAVLLHPDSGAMDAGAISTTRTGLFSVFAVATAWLALRPRFRESRWLVYPLLVLGGFALVLGDFRHGRPATMFVSLVVYGGALILAPRLLKMGRRSGQAEA